jgi:2-polyprenyl-6-methoxyphenol hydroxylase-like FAD-dependent oxidoreductase
MSASKPILIVGAGPTGLTAATELSRFGVPVRIVDRLPVRSRTSRALAVHARTLELLGQRGVGADMIRLGNPATRVSLFGDSKLLGRLDLTRVPSRHNFVLMLSQAETERLLEERLQAQGVEVERGTELIAHENRRDPAAGVRAVLRNGAGELEELEAAYVISAEGAHSSMRTTAGLPFDGHASAQRYALGDLSLETELPDSDMSIFIGRHGFLAAFPMGNRRFRFIATDPSRTESEPTLEELQSLYNAVAPVPARMHDLNWSSRFRINSRVLGTLRAGNVFFGGDAAHVHSPAGGQGMNTGIQDMINLSWKLALVTQGIADPRLLATYSTERLHVIKSIVSRTERATDALNSDSALLHRAITVGASVMLSRGKTQTTGPKVISQTAANYRRSAASQPSGGPGPLRGGDRIPDIAVTPLDDGEGQPVPLYELLDPTGFTLLVIGDADPTGVERRLDGWPVTILRIAAAGPGRDGAASLGGAPSFVLVRPDAYAAVVCTAFQAVEGWLRTWLPGRRETTA